MKNFYRTSFLALLVLSAGCRAPSWYANEWRGFPYKDAEEALNEYRGVILVCVTADRVEQSEFELAGVKKSAGYTHHYTGTVVRSFKGSCRIGDQFNFAKGYCPCGGKREMTTNAHVGKLMFLLLEDDVRGGGPELGIDPTFVDEYAPETYRLFSHVFRNSSKRATSPIGR